MASTKYTSAPETPGYGSLGIIATGAWCANMLPARTGHGASRSEVNWRKGVDLVRCSVCAIIGLTELS